jgi:hypothetical protein
LPLPDVPVATLRRRTCNSAVGGMTWYCISPLSCGAFVIPIHAELIIVRARARTRIKQGLAPETVPKEKGGFNPGPFPNRPYAFKGVPASGSSRIPESLLPLKAFARRRSPASEKFSLLGTPRLQPWPSQTHAKNRGLAPRVCITFHCPYICPHFSFPIFRPKIACQAPKPSNSLK